jgi:hypothetical protein
MFKEILYTTGEDVRKASTHVMQTVYKTQGGSLLAASGISLYYCKSLSALADIHCYIGLQTATRLKRHLMINSDVNGEKSSGR